MCVLMVTEYEIVLADGGIAALFNCSCLILFAKTTEFWHSRDRCYLFFFIIIIILFLLATAREVSCTVNQFTWRRCDFDLKLFRYIYPYRKTVLTIFSTGKTIIDVIYNRFAYIFVSITRKRRDFNKER